MKIWFDDQFLKNSILLLERIYDILVRIHAMWCAMMIDSAGHLSEEVADLKAPVSTKNICTESGRRAIACFIPLSQADLECGLDVNLQQQLRSLLNIEPLAREIQKLATEVPQSGNRQSNV